MTLNNFLLPMHLRKHAHRVRCYAPRTCFALAIVIVAIAVLPSPIVLGLDALRWGLELGLSKDTAVVVGLLAGKASFFMILSAVCLLAGWNWLMWQTIGRWRFRSFERRQAKRWKVLTASGVPEAIALATVMKEALTQYRGAIRNSLWIVDNRSAHAFDDYMEWLGTKLSRLLTDPSLPREDKRATLKVTEDYLRLQRAVLRLKRRELKI